METLRLVDAGNALSVDVCPKCNGVWLDSTEDKHLSSFIESYQRESSAREHAEGNAGGAKTYLFQLLTGFPREVYNPVKNRSWVTFIILVILALFYIWELQVGEKQITQLALVPALLWQGHQVWGLLTNVFLHADLLHLIGNMYFLYIFGDNIEDRLGKIGFLAIFFLAAVVGSLAHAATHSGDVTPCVGASGGVAGLLAAYVYLFPRVKLWVVLFFVRFKLSAAIYVGIWLAYQVLMAFLAQPQVAWYAHIGGFLAGLLAASLFRRFSQQELTVLGTN